MNLRYSFKIGVQKNKELKVFPLTKKLLFNERKNPGKMLPNIEISPTLYTASGTGNCPVYRGNPSQCIFVSPWPARNVKITINLIFRPVCTGKI